jgi:S1-C subfamily serine protease
MHHSFLILGTILLSALTLSCAPLSAPPPSQVVPNQTTRQIVRERLSGVVVTSRGELGSWANQNFSMKNAPDDADGGSTTPITDDGYFLTADHVLAKSPGKNVFIIYANGGNLITRKARIVWRSFADDIAILHIEAKTTYHYEWTDPKSWLSAGHPVIHGGIATGSKTDPGKLRTPLEPEGSFTCNRPFKIDIPLKPGDSGGPVVDAYGRLIGINSAVEFLVPLETAIFIDSEGNRPNTKKIQGIIEKDRHGLSFR